jgi:hypothetical protein
MTYTREEQHAINTGNIMLSQAGMPLMTDAQEQAFIQKQRAKNSPPYHDASMPGGTGVAIGVAAVLAYLLYRAFKK